MGCPRVPGSPGGGQDPGDHPRDGGGPGNPVGVGEQQVSGTDQGGERVAMSAPAIQRKLLDGLGAAVEAAGGAFTMSYTTIAATPPGWPRSGGEEPAGMSVAGDLMGA
jgi:hypothetical protein